MSVTSRELRRRDLHGDLPAEPGLCAQVQIVPDPGPARVIPARPRAPGPREGLPAAGKEPEMKAAAEEQPPVVGDQIEGAPTVLTLPRRRSSPRQPGPRGAGSLPQQPRAPSRSAASATSS